MKSPLVIDLIRAHLSGNESEFAESVERLAEDEDKKGNAVLALQLREAYEGKWCSRPVHAVEPYRDPTYIEIQSMKLEKEPGLYDIRIPKVSFRDMVLNDKVRNTFNRVQTEWTHADFLPNGIGPTRSILMVGPPGCGKTMAAEAMAKAIGVPLVVVSLDSLISPYFGQTGGNIGRVFDSVKQKRCVLFFDEFESVGKDRLDGNDIGESKRMLSSLLQNLDSMTEGILLMAATNIPEMLDPAAVRRFDRTVVMSLPTADDRRKLIETFYDKHHVRIASSIDIIVDVTSGMSFAETDKFLANVVRDCAACHKSYAEEKDLVDIAGGASSIAIRMHRNGESLRRIEEITGIPRSTLSHRFSKDVRM